MTNSVVKVMTVAGSDSGGGAGIQADLKTIAALGAYGTSTITSVTAQNTRRVVSVFDVPVDMVKQQFDTVISDIGADAIKTGMLSSSLIIDAVATKIREHAVKNLIVDPVMVSKGGDRLLQEDALNALKTKLLPLATLITPNVEEAGVLVGRKLETLDDIRSAAEEIVDMGSSACVVTGGISPGPATDFLYDGDELKAFSGGRIPSNNTHGTGCTFASACAVYIARGELVKDSVAQAKRYVTNSIKAAYPVGTGYGPLNHLYGLSQKAEF